MMRSSELINVHATRVAALILSLPPFTSVRGQRSLLYSGPSLWNRLPFVLKNEIVNNVHIETFKKKLRSHLMENQLTL